jgi:hypothetical protein
VVRAGIGASRRARASVRGGESVNGRVDRRALRFALPRLWLGIALSAALVAAGGSSGAQPPTCDGKTATVSGSNGTAADDVIIGTPGDDLFYAGGGDDTICGLDGADRIFADNPDDVGADYIEGGDGRDVIDAGRGDDRIDGGSGDGDTLWYSRYSDEPAFVDLQAGTAEGPEGSDTIVVGTIENVEMNCSGPARDTIVGDADANVLVGGSGADHLRGLGGDDVLVGTYEYLGQTDAICWESAGDTDVLEGGEGDDVLHGQVAADLLDGGPGFDSLDGGAASDECAAGERYASCEVATPTDAREGCSDSSDNDGDGRVDHPSDDGCASPRDPTEDGPDAACNDGMDNDGDGLVDVPEDDGCFSYSDGNELTCHWPCRRPKVTIRYTARRDLFVGDVAHPGTCAPDRTVVVMEDRRRDRIVGRATSGDDGRWSVSFATARGSFFAVLESRTFVSSEGDTTRCAEDRSKTIRVP